MDFVLDLKKNHGINIKTINIGGGMSSSYTEPEEPTGYSFADYHQLLENQVPELFSGKYKIITEFGGSLLLKAGTTLSKVEYIKQWLPDITPIILTHVGANQFPTEVYLQDVRKRRFDLADKTGKLQTSPKKMFDIAGPLCFQVLLLSCFILFDVRFNCGQ
jgi:diaminopimelate decarboxylase